MVYAVMCVAIFSLSLPEYSLVNQALACVLLITCTFPLMRYIQCGSGVPLVELPLASYAVFFVLPIMVEDSHAVFRGIIRPRDDFISMVYFCSILAVISTYAGYSALRRRFDSASSLLSSVRPSKSALVTISFALIAVNIVFRLSGFSYSSTWSRAVQVLFSQDLGIAILALLYFQNRLSQVEANATIAVLVVLTFFGLLSGMTQQTAQPLFVWVLCRWIVVRTFPLYPAILGVAFVLFLQPIKLEYRNQFWNTRRAEEVSRIDKLIIYGQIASQYWLTASESKSDTLEARTRSSISQRFSLLLFTQRYFELTPSLIPYKNGESLFYVLYGWVPRAIWPGKPTATMANQQFPVEYGIQHPETVRTASFGVGHIAEVYVNYGVLGFVPVFFLLGCVTFIPRMFGGGVDDIAVTSIQVVSAINLMFIGSTVGIVFGGLITQVIAQSVIFILGTRFLGAE